VIKLRGLGATRLGRGGRGDVLVHVSVHIPTTLTGEERALYEQLAAARGESAGGATNGGIFRRLRESLRGQ
jgi:molecular chaperone DnaJ